MHSLSPCIDCSTTWECTRGTGTTCRQRSGVSLSHLGDGRGKLFLSRSQACVTCPLTGSSLSVRKVSDCPRTTTWLISTCHSTRTSRSRCGLVLTEILRCQSKRKDAEREGSQTASPNCNAVSLRLSGRWDEENAKHQPHCETLDVSDITSHGRENTHSQMREAVDGVGAGPLDSDRTKALTCIRWPQPKGTRLQTSWPIVREPSDSDTYLELRTRLVLPMQDKIHDSTGFLAVSCPPLSVLPAARL